MKLNDIHQNLKKELNIKNIKKDFAILNQINIKRNINDVICNLEDIYLNKNKRIQLSNKQKEDLDWFKTTKNKRINLKALIFKSNSFNYKITLFYLRNIKPFFLKLDKNTVHLKLDSKKRKKIHFLAYVILFLCFVFFDKIIIERTVISWIDDLYSIKYLKNIEKIELKLLKAKTKFNISLILFYPFKIIPRQNIKNAANWIEILQNVSQLWLGSVSFYRKNISFIYNKKITDIYFANLIENSKPFFIDFWSSINDIANKLDSIVLDENLSDWSNYLKLNNLRSKIHIVSEKINILNKNWDFFLDILWKEKLKKYLIVFQNNDEIRPTWGFMGSAWIIEIFAWKIKKIEKRDIYAYEWDINRNYTEKVKAPTGVELLSWRLWLRDSNAFIDFSKSSKSINYFMKKWWYNLDWVIYINQKTVLDILDMLWNIEFSKYNSMINSSNFSEIISLLVEAKVSKKATLDTPKQVLFDFWNILVAKIKKDKKYSKIVEIIFNNIVSRDIVFYTFNKKNNSFLELLELTWKFDYNKQVDFNYPFYISVWWNKTDRYMKRKYFKYINIEKKEWKCNLNTTLKIHLNNIFTKKDEDRILWEMDNFWIDRNIDLLNIAWKWINKSYTKVIIPKDAIIDIDNLKKYWYILVEEENYKTVEKLLITKSWKQSYFELNYRLDDINCKKQNIKLYKQAWIYEYDIDFNYRNDNLNQKENLKLDWLKQDFYYNNVK